MVRAEKASLSADRLSMGLAWLGKEPPHLTDTSWERLRNNARIAFDLCKKYNIRRAHEGRRVSAAEAAVRKALGIKDGVR